MTSAVTRFWERVALHDDDQCWLWTATCSPSGYGRFCANYKETPAHRFSYERLVGPIPDGLVIDHLCRVRNCVNPRHMEPVTLGENSRRGDNANRRKTHCPRGHAYAEHGETNRQVSGGPHRFCRLCYQARKRAEG